MIYAKHKFANMTGKKFVVEAISLMPLNQVNFAEGT